MINLLRKEFIMTFLSVILIAFLIGITYYLYRKKIINKKKEIYKKIK